MNRRSFLKSSAALGAALASSQIEFPNVIRRIPQAKRTLKKAVMIGMVAEGQTLEEKFRILIDCGFSGVELDSPSKTPREEVLKAMEKTGIVVHGLVDSVHWTYLLNSPAEKEREKAIEALKTALKDGQAFKSSSVLLVPAVVNQKLPYDQAYIHSQEGIKAVLPLAKECGVKIAVENVWNDFLLSPLEAARYVDEFQSEWVGFHMDLGNVINIGYPAQWVRILGKRILKLHIKDYSRKRRDEEGRWKGFDVELGDGDCGWGDVMKELDAIGYSTAPEGRWATAEVRGGDRKRLKEIAERMDKIFAL